MYRNILGLGKPLKYTGEKNLIFDHYYNYNFAQLFNLRFSSFQILLDLRLAGQSLMPGFGDCEDGANSLRAPLHCSKARCNVSALTGDHHQLVTGTEGKHTGTVRRARSGVAVVVHHPLSSELDQTRAGRSNCVAIVPRVLRRLLEDVSSSDEPRCGKESSELYPVVAGFLNHNFRRIFR